MIDSIALKHSEMLSENIRQLIRNRNGKISFAEYMQQALYAPGLGYYNNGSAKFGTQGDFITAPELGSLFAKCVATQCLQVFEKINSFSILEFGAGSGQLAYDLIAFFTNANVKIDKYYILELSPDLKQRQKQKLKDLPVEWLDTLPIHFKGVMIANEVIDAMPVHKFLFDQDQLFEYYVTIINNNFEFILEQPNNNLKQAFDILKLKPQPYSSEINLYINPWIKSLSDCLNGGAILLFDYGFNRQEYYHPQRNAGTLMCHYKHRAHTDPFFLPGLQDITAHVDFSCVANAAKQNNLHIDGYGNLASFLLNCGIDKFVDAHISPTCSQELNYLCSPAEMGELFKALILTRDIDDKLIGFKSYDRQQKLELS